MECTKFSLYESFLYEKKEKVNDSLYKFISINFPLSLKLRAKNGRHIANVPDLTISEV